MGRTQGSIHIVVSRSSHNSPKDEVEKALVQLLTAEINALCKQDKYEAIKPMVDGWDGY